MRYRAISADGQSAISGSFDSTAIRWSLTHNSAEQVLRFHADAVNAVVLLAGGRAATAGADGCLDRVTLTLRSLGNGTPPGYLVGYQDPDFIVSRHGSLPHDTAAEWSPGRRRDFSSLVHR